MQILPDSSVNIGLSGKKCDKRIQSDKGYKTIKDIEVFRYPEIGKRQEKRQV